MRRLVSLVALVTACDSVEETSVRIDLTGLWQGAQTDLTDRFSMAELTVTGAGMTPIVVSLDPSDLSFELDVPSGLARTFALEGYEPDADSVEHLTRYWGYDRVDLPAGGTVDISIPIARAGRLPGTVSLEGGVAVPASVELTFDYYSDPIAELPGPFTVAATNGAFSVPLPLGSVVDPFREYMVTVGPVSVMGVSYGLPEPAVGSVSQHGLNQPLYLMLVPTSCVVGDVIECCSDNDCDGACDLETNLCEVPCVVGGDIQCCSDANCGDGGICNLDTNLCGPCVVGGAVQCCLNSDCSSGDTCNIVSHVCEACVVGGAIACCGDLDCVDATCNVQTNLCEPACVVGGMIECCGDPDCIDGNCNLETNLCEASCVVGGAIECCGDGDCTELGWTCNTGTNVCETVYALVQVFDADGAPTADSRTVMVHDSAGVYVRESSTTLGETLVEVGFGDMVSVLYDYMDSYQNYDVYTAAGVAPGDTLRFQLPGYVNTNNVREGDIEIFESSTPPGGTVTQRVSIPGDGDYPVPVGGPYLANLWTWNLGDDGDLDILGWARDGNSALLGFAVHTGITPQTGGMLTLGNWDLSPLSLDFTFANTPGKPGMFIQAFRDGVEYDHDQYVNPFMGSGSFQVPAGFFDYIDAVTYIDNFPGDQRIFRRFVGDVWTNPVQTDFDSDLLPPFDNSTMPPDFDFTTVPARPAMIWANPANPADFDATLIQVTIDSGMDKFNWWVVAPPTITSPYSMPDLSGVATIGFHPEEYSAQGYASGEIQIIDTDSHLDYRDYLNTRGVRGIGLGNGDWPVQDLVIIRSRAMVGG